MNKSALTLFFLASSALMPSLALAAEVDYDVTLSGYVTRMVLALLLFGAAGYFAVKYLPSRFRLGAAGKLRLLGALNVGRDMIYVVQTGPRVVALFVGKATSSVIGSWSAEEWEAYEASREPMEQDGMPPVKAR